MTAYASRPHPATWLLCRVDSSVLGWMCPARVPLPQEKPPLRNTWPRCPFPPEFFLLPQSLDSGMLAQMRPVVPFPNRCSSCRLPLPAAWGRSPLTHGPHWVPGAESGWRWRPGEASWRDGRQAAFPRGCVGGSLREAEGSLGAFSSLTVCSSWLGVSGWL